MKKFLAGAFALLMFVSFAATASAFVPPGLAKKQGLPPGLEEKAGELPPGIQKRFGDIEELQKGLAYEYNKTILQMDADNRRIVIEEGTAQLHLLVADNAKIELDGKIVSFKDLYKNDEVQLKLNDELTIIEIIGSKGKDRIPAEKYEEVKGKIDAINSTRREITVISDNTKRLYDIDSNAKIWIDDASSRLTRLEKGMEVTLKIEEDKVVEIYGFSDIQTHEGRLMSVKITEEENIIILRIGEENRTFTVEKRIDLSEISLGATIRIQVKNNEVYRLAEK
ncbi:hypothetical protein Amet_0089 [Alkaliphilus metalliredigens QYMF]|uniref:DUF5666 domain-containing protein n=1 Tax=Alkaliphilus metalliredigens (strain QYMF) TaxID=293826 RepID=A6TJG4_ALKMQ|nr:hypothetical protein [Alkaliphilus metalliredigens]ABR46332.1 hypothetical protein Amet_0089 [Alkaliphilus metalliredigens QYMF]